MESTPERVRDYKLARDELVARQTKALADRLKGHLRGELKVLLTAIRKDGGKAFPEALRSKADKPPRPPTWLLFGQADILDEWGLHPGAVLAEGGAAVAGPVFDLHALIGRTDYDISVELTRFFRHISEAGVDLANSAWGAKVDPYEVIHEVRALATGHVPEAMAWIRRSFPSDMESLFSDLAYERIDQRGLQEAIRDLYATAYTRAEGVARTEAAWAYERSAYVAFRESGVEALGWSFGGGPCTSGICFHLDGKVVAMEEHAAAGFGPFPEPAGDFMGIIQQPPAHPNCTCCLIPLDAENVNHHPMEAAPAGTTAPPVPAVQPSEWYDESLEAHLSSSGGSPVGTTPLGNAHVNDVLRGTLPGYADDVVIKPGSGWKSCWRDNIPQGSFESSAARERSVYLLDRYMDHFFEVPETLIGMADAGNGPELSVIMRMVPGDGTVGSIVSPWFSSADIDWTDHSFHRTAVLDFLIGNQDRHGGNIFVQQDPSTGITHYVPIDHNLTFPTVSSEDVGNGEWFNAMPMTVVEDMSGLNPGMLDLDDDTIAALSKLKNRMAEARADLEGLGLEGSALDLMEERLDFLLTNLRLPTMDEAITMG